MAGDGGLSLRVIDSTLSLAHLAELFKRLKASLSADRYLILLGPDDQAGFLVAQSEGVDAENAFTSEPIALAVVQQVCLDGRPFYSEKPSDLQPFDSNALLLSGIQAVVCVPLFGQNRRVMGLLYADKLSAVGQFTYTDLLNVQNVAQGLSSKKVTPARVSASAKPQVGTGLTPGVRLRAQETAQFFVQLATLVKSGIPLLQGLEGLLKQAESARVRQLLERLLPALFKGQSLSEGLRLHGDFPALVVSLVRCAERSGQLVLSLELLSRTLERQQQRILKLRAALVYPGFLLGISLLLVALMPSVLLKNQLEFYQAQKMHLPALSLFCLKVGQMLAHPISWLLLSLSCAGLWVFFRRAEQKKRLVRNLQLVLEHLPWTRRVQRLYWECLVLNTLHILLLAGVDTLEATAMAADSAASFAWNRQRSTLLEDLRNGETMADALARTGLTSRSTRPLLSAAEESGRLAQALGWVSRILETDFDQSVEMATKLLEPLVLLLLGCLVGLVTLASLLPSIHYMQQL